MINARAVVLDILMETEKGNEYSNILIRQVLDKYDYLEIQDKAFIKRLAEGTVERQITLDYVLNQFSKTPVDKMKTLIRCLLRMSVYQILYMDAVPDSAVCNEAVKLAEKRHFGSLKGFVNGVLRNISRSREQIRWPEESVDWKAALSVRTSMPLTILNIWETEYGKELTSLMAEASLDVKPVCIRMDERLSAKEQEVLLDAWTQKGIRVKQSEYLPYAYFCEALEGVPKIPGFKEGKITVQDVSSMLVTECAAIKEGDFVIDVCAAPGGKSLHAASHTGMSGTVESRDLTEYKVKMICDNADRMHLPNIHTTIWDATLPDESMKEKADVLLLDVPCSGLGIIGHKRDIKYHVTEENLLQLQDLQKEIAAVCCDYVRKGGTVLYSTCTIHQEENEKMALWMAENLNLEFDSLDPYLPRQLISEQTAQGMLQLFPGKHDCDGFFLARFQKK